MAGVDPDMAEALTSLSIELEDTREVLHKNTERRRRNRPWLIGLVVAAGVLIIGNLLAVLLVNSARVDQGKEKDARLEQGCEILQRDYDTIHSVVIQAYRGDGIPQQIKDAFPEVNWDEIEQSSSDAANAQKEAVLKLLGKRPDDC